MSNALRTWNSREPLRFILSMASNREKWIKEIRDEGRRLAPDGASALAEMAQTLHVALDQLVEARLVAMELRDRCRSGDIEGDPEVGLDRAYSALGGAADGSPSTCSLGLAPTRSLTTVVTHYQLKQEVDANDLPVGNQMANQADEMISSPRIGARCPQRWISRSVPQHQIVIMQPRLSQRWWTRSCFATPLGGPWSAIRSWVAAP